MIYFSSSLADTEAYIGAAGELVDTYEVSGDGWTDVYQRYRYAMRWFDGEAPMNTNYVYRNGFLERIELRPEETGYTADQVRQLIGAMYGEPTREEAGETSWADPIYSKYITLSADEKGCLGHCGQLFGGHHQCAGLLPGERRAGRHQRPGGPGGLGLPVRHPAPGSPAKNRGIQPVHRWDQQCAGLHLAHERRETTDNTRFSISVDYYDVYDENGNKRDWSKLAYTILHEYGHVLLEDETQVDLSLGSGTHDPACFIEGFFRKAFYDTFWSHLGDTGVGDYDKDPTRYVSRYGANYFHEDIADTFAVFVLGGEPQGDTVAEEKVRFFWQDPAMTALRAAIRQNLGLDWPR